MLRLIWSGPAVTDLRGIREYLGAHDKRIAVRTLRAIREKADLLGRYPAAGPTLSGQYRQLVVRGTPYIIVYVAGDDRIDILRIRHGSEDWRPAS